MYRVYDTDAIIRFIQKYLIVINGDSDPLAPNGIYDDRTKAAVREFQKNNGLEITGVVNEPTISALFDEQSREQIKKRTRKQTHPFIQFPISPGEKSDGMIQIHQAMAKALNYYGHTHQLRQTSYFNEQTMIAVDLLRKIYLLENDAKIDETFYFRLMNDFESINKIQDY